MKANNINRSSLSNGLHTHTKKKKVETQKEEKKKLIVYSFLLY